MAISAGAHLDVSNAAANTTITLTAPADVVPGALLWAQISLGTMITAVPAGWTQVAAALLTGSPRLYAYYRVADATDTPGSTYAWTYNSATGSGTLQTYFGVDPVSPVDVASQTAAGGSATSFPVPGVVTVTDGALLLTGAATASTTLTPVLTVPAGFTKRFDTIPKRHALADRGQPVAGDPGVLTWTVSAASAWTAYSTALRPEAAAGPVTYLGAVTFGAAGQLDAGAVVVPPSAAPASLWALTDTPTVPENPSTVAIEVGLRFTTSTAGTVVGLRFYKALNNTGVHVGTLWGPTGTSLATVTFTGETATGWQTGTFSSAVPISTGQSYIVSVFDPAGHYPSDLNYFAAPYVNAPLTGVTGVFHNSTAGYPTSTYQASNYWVDVLLQTGVAQPPVAVGSVSLRAPGHLNASPVVVGAPPPPVIGGSASLRAPGQLLASPVVVVASTTTPTLYVRSGSTLVPARLGIRTGATVTYLSPALGAAPGALTTETGAALTTETGSPLTT